MTITDRDHDILRALADGEERHGYTIIQTVEEHTNGRVILGPGTLYRAIARLLDDGLIVQTDRRPDPALEDERRRYYRLTPRGRALLDQPGTPLAPLAAPPPPDPGPAYRQYDVLRVLADGQERHGHAIARAVGALPGMAPLGPTTLYVTLRRLLTNGFVAEAAPRADPALDDKPREHYRITPQGAEALRTPGLLPLPPRTAAQERAYAVLCALADGAEQHGYGLIKDLRAAQGGAGRVGSGTLYRILDTLLADGLVVETGTRPDPAVNPHAPRRHYRLTPRGEEARRMLATLPPHQPDPASVWRGAVSFGVAWGTATGGLLFLLGAGGGGWATGAAATVITTGAGLLRRDEAGSRRTTA
jgi:DNA-binding PadR family transcriptional regulator